jgi:hypothetical protein
MIKKNSKESDKVAKTNIGRKLCASLCAPADDFIIMFLHHNPSPSFVHIALMTPHQLAPTMGQLRVGTMILAAFFH